MNICDKLNYHYMELAKHVGWEDKRAVIIYIQFKNKQERKSFIGVEIIR